MGGFKKVHTPHKGLAAAHHKREHVSMSKRDDCASGGFYTAPTAGQSFDSAKAVTFSWNNQCLSPAPKFVDIYLYAPSKNDSMIQAFSSASYSKGHTDVNLDPNWWGLDTSVQLQLQIVAHGSSQLMTDYAAGPIFTATYDPSEAGAPKASTDKPSIAQRVKNVLDGLPGGSVAAAVIFPLLAVIGVCAFFWIRRQRRARAAKSNRFSKAVDQRMSTISVDWRSTSGAGANAAVRASMAIPRDASFGDNGARPTSIFDNRAGIGALATSEEPVPQMEEMRRARQSVFTTGERQSRISFAPDTRMSYAEKENPRLPSAVRGLNVRSFHQAHSFEEERDEYDEKHPVPNRELNMSPTQANGPALLQPGEIAARASSDNDREFQREVLQMPAMTLMRTGGKGGDSDFVLPQAPPVPVIPTTAPLSTPGTNAAAYPYGPSSFDTTNAMPMPSPVHYAYGPSGAISPSPSSAPSTAQSFTPMNGGMGTLNQTYPTAAASPDALLRVYASQRLASSTPSTPAANISTPSAIPTSSANGGMRILYHNEPTTVPALAYPFPSTPSAGTGSISTGTGTGRMSLAPGDNNPFRKSMAASHLDVSEHEHTRASNAYTESMYSAGTGPYNGQEHGHGLGDDDEDDEAAYDDHTGHSGWSAHAQ